MIQRLSGGAWSRLPAVTLLAAAVAACSDSLAAPGDEPPVAGELVQAFLPGLEDVRTRLIPVVHHADMRRRLDDRVARLQRDLNQGAPAGRIRDGVLQAARSLSEYQAVAPGGLGPDLTAIRLMLYRAGELVGVTPTDIDQV